MLRRVLAILPLVLVVLGFTVILGAIVVGNKSSIGVDEVSMRIGRWSLVVEPAALEVIHRNAIGVNGIMIDKHLLTLDPFAVGLALVVPGAVWGAVVEARRRQRARRGFPITKPEPKP